MRIIFLLVLVVMCISPLYSGPYVRTELGIAGNIEDTIFTDIEVGWRIRYKDLFSQTSVGIRTWVLTNFNDNVGGQFIPFQTIYTVNQTFKYSIFFMEFQHYCAHPVVNSYTVNEGQVEPGIVAPEWWNGSVTTFSIGAEIEFDF